MLAAKLQTLLGCTFDMYLRAQGFHWNVEGKDFHEFHAFFADIYEDVYSAIDPLAENIRKVGAYAPFTLATLASLSDVKPDKVNTDAINMCVSLLDANETVLECIMEACEAAKEAREEGIANFLAERDDMHKKWKWQLESTIKR